MPSSAEAAIVGIADRIDTLVGIFGIGKSPTGSADPFALRRACLTSIAIILHQKFRLNIKDVVLKSHQIYGDSLVHIKQEELKDNLLEFYLGRLTGFFHENTHGGLPAGFAFDTIKAVVQASCSWYDFTDLVQRLDAMNQFRERDDFFDVAATFKRANNIIRGESINGNIDPDKFNTPEEKSLWDSINSTEEAVADRLEKGDYLDALKQIVPLRLPVNQFFDSVLVNDPDQELKLNRQCLIKKVVDLVLRVADFSSLQE
jgi:glycyl-tRNA synthetase beta chain